VELLADTLGKDAYMGRRRSRCALIGAAVLVPIGVSMTASAAQQEDEQATITVNTTHVENHISPRMYAAFVEIMAEDVNRGLTAEMIRHRSFEEAPDYLGLPADWRLEPDIRNDNVGAIALAPVTSEAYPLRS
jgi:hypothetical protein